MIHYIRKQIEITDGRVDFDDWISRATLDIIGLATFDHDFESITNPSGVLAQTYRRILSLNRWSQILGFLNFFMPPWVWRLIP